MNDDVCNGRLRNPVCGAGHSPALPAWAAVLSLTMGVFGLLTAEYLPASLLTPMAASLQVSQAQAGQSITATAIAALFAGLALPTLTRRFDRRTVLLAFGALMIVSNLLVAAAPNLIVLLAMRVLLGVALGGFWSMAAAVTMRLVPPASVSRALSVIFSGIAIGTVVSVPLGSYLGGLFGWRSAFLAAAALGAVTLIVQWLHLPSMPPNSPARAGSSLALLRRPAVGSAMLGCILAHTGQFILFTYIRPALEFAAHVDVAHLSLLLLAFGAANFLGTVLAGWLMERSLRATLIVMPAFVGLAALGIVLMPSAGVALVPGITFWMALWGLAFGGVPVAWSRWVTRAIPDQAEAAGGMVVASVQASIAAGAALGGWMFSYGGISTVFIHGGLVMVAAAAFIALFVRTPAPSSDAA